MAASKRALANKTLLKVKDKKDSRTVSVNVNRESLQLTSNKLSKSVKESAFSKASGLSCKQHGQQVPAGLLHGSEHILTQFKNQQPQSVQLYE